MRNRIWIPIIIIFSFACNQEGKKTTSYTAQQSDTTKKDSIVRQKVIIQPYLSKTDSFLLNPFDLYRFKKKKRGSNSSGKSKEEYYYKPDYEGIYYKFFLFEPLKGYIGTSKDSIVHNLYGLTIVTYKNTGEYKEKYLDPEEILIEVKAQYNDFDLPELAFIGIDTASIRKRLGNECGIKNNCMVYSYSDKVLILGIKDKSVNWLRYLHLNAAKESCRLNEKLYKYDFNSW